MKRGENLHENVFREMSLVASMTLSHRWYSGSLVQWHSFLFEMVDRSKVQLAHNHICLHWRTKCWAEGLLRFVLGSKMRSVGRPWSWNIWRISCFRYTDTVCTDTQDFCGQSILGTWTRSPPANASTSPKLAWWPGVQLLRHGSFRPRIGDGCIMSSGAAYCRVDLWERIPPTPVVEATMFTTNWRDGSGIVRMRAEVKSLSLAKALSTFLFQQNCLSGG